MLPVTTKKFKQCPKSPPTSHICCSVVSDVTVTITSWCCYTLLTFTPSMKCSDLQETWTQGPDCVFWVMLNTDVLIPGCNVPLSLWQGAVIALATVIWGGLKLRAGEWCIIKVGHAEKSRAVPKEGSQLKTGTEQKEFQKTTIRSRLDVARQNLHTAGSVWHFVVLKRFVTV